MGIDSLYFYQSVRTCKEIRIRKENRIYRQINIHILNIQNPGCTHGTKWNCYVVKMTKTWIDMFFTMMPIDFISGLSIETTIHCLKHTIQYETDWKSPVFLTF